MKTYFVAFFGACCTIFLSQNLFAGSEGKFPWYLYAVVDPDIFSPAMNDYIKSSSAKEYVEHLQTSSPDKLSSRDAYILWDRLGLETQLEINEANRIISARAGGYYLNDVKSDELVFYEEYWGKIKDPYYLNKIKEDTSEENLRKVFVWVGKLAKYEDTKRSSIFARWQEVNDSNFVAAGEQLVIEGSEKYKKWEDKYFKWLEEEHRVENNLWNKISGNDKVEPIKAPEWLKDSYAKDFFLRASLW